MGDWCILDDTSQEIVRRIKSVQNTSQENKKLKNLVKNKAEIAFPVDRDFLMGDSMIMWWQKCVWI